MGVQQKINWKNQAKKKMTIIDIYLNNKLKSLFKIDVLSNKTNMLHNITKDMSNNTINKQ